MTLRAHPGPGSSLAYTCDRAATALRRPPIYTLPVIVVSFAIIAILAVWIEMPLWMFGLAAGLALLGYLLERKRPT